MTDLGYLDVRWCGSCRCEALPAALEEEERCEICNALTYDGFGDYVDSTLMRMEACDGLRND